ncbi:copper amine oxidase N-terminal domain-containing protein [Paenibacillus sp. MWE-103]|uniref:Copper amine oxidase N-terminal domain-containing protein n=2 Tax=Paenibacillus artemisiicola TaxID=1172618 RepID=A0ABS3WBK1_9BACL|nr:copper amine oxidase N-terminal domain-containing protein [Paenibacillus artemisiicola]MBO7745683.1 copper amine oxidase N-terminal domain-containing protein [Paenibacillus artemisiicola]
MTFQKEPIVVDGTMMVPFRELCGILGMNVRWNGEKKIATATSGGLSFVLNLSVRGLKNGTPFLQRQAPFLSGSGVLYVSLRSVGEAAGIAAGWDSLTKTATVATANGAPKPLTRKEILQTDWLRADWTKEQMEEAGFDKEVDESGAETTYTDGSVTYTYFDFDRDPTPGAVDVRDALAGPRGIRTGDTFEQVMSSFPQYRDWREGLGIFYGKSDPYKGYTIGPTGYVKTYDGEKEVTLCAEDRYPFMRIFFHSGVVSHFTIYLIDASH